MKNSQQKIEFIKKIFSKYDLYDLIAEGAPSNEYDGIALNFYIYLEKVKSKDLLIEKIKDIFNAEFGNVELDDAKLNFLVEEILGNI